MRYRRNNRIHIVVSGEERLEWEAMAERMRMTISELIRRAVYEYIRSEGSRER
jgi:hypothetical protein